MRTEQLGDFEVTTDGVTVWINARSGMVARYTRGHIDVPMPASEAMSLSWDITHANDREYFDRKGWHCLVAQAQERFGVTLDPSWFPRGRLPIVEDPTDAEVPS
jgi:hypothetical protein